MCVLLLLRPAHSNKGTLGTWTQENTEILLLDNFCKLRLLFVAREMDVLLFCNQ